MKNKKKAVKKEKKPPFLILWVPGSHIAPQRRYKNEAEAAKIAEWLIRDKGVEQVYTLKPIKVSQKVVPVVHSRRV